MNKPVTDLPHPKMLLDPYAGWAANEGVPITEDFGVDLRTVPTAPWARFDTNGGIVHLKGRGDFVSIFVLDLAPGAKSSPQKHLFEEVVYVLSGHGNPCGALDHEALKPGAISADIAAFFTGLTAKRHDSLIGFGWAMAEDLAARVGPGK